MKKILSIALILVLSLTLLAGCGGGAAEGEGETPEAKVYNIATDTTFAPFEFQNDAGEYVGIDIDILAAVAEDQGFEYELNPWASALPLPLWNPTRLMPSLPA